MFMDHTIDLDYRTLITGAKAMPAPEIDLILKLVRLEVLFDLLYILFVASGKAGTAKAYSDLYQNFFYF